MTMRVWPLSFLNALWRRAGLSILLLLSLCGALVPRLSAVEPGSFYDTLRIDTVQLNPNADSLRQTLQESGFSEASRIDSAGIARYSSAHATPLVVTNRPESPSRWRLFCDSMPQGYVALAALTLPGAGQVINGQYWKLPLFYGSIGGFLWLGLYGNRQFRSLSAQIPPSDRLGILEYRGRVERWRYMSYGAFTAAGIVYALSVADALVSHSPHHHSPTAALVSSILLPGLGQIYNGAYWKVPIIYGTGFWLVSQYLHTQRLYTRFDQSLTSMLDGDPSTQDEFEGTRTQQELEYFRDYYQRYRDLYVIGLSLLYVLNVVDAYVDAHLFYWNVDENLAFRAEPMLHPLYGGVDGMAVALNLRMDF